MMSTALGHFKKERWGKYILNKQTKTTSIASLGEKEERVGMSGKGSHFENISLCKKISIEMGAST